MQYDSRYPMSPGQSTTYQISYTIPPIVLLCVTNAIAIDPNSCGWVYNVNTSSFVFGAGFNSSVWAFYYMAIGY